MIHTAKKTLSKEELDKLIEERADAKMKVKEQATITEADAEKIEIEDEPKTEPKPAGKTNTYACRCGYSDDSIWWKCPQCGREVESWK